MRLDRAFLIGLILLLLVAALVWQQPATQAFGVGSSVGTPATPSATVGRTGGVFVLDQSPPTARGVTTTPQAGNSPPNKKPPAPFAFLGRITEDGAPVVLLHRAGTVLKIRGIGPVADDYEVDSLLENVVVLRYVPLGTQQVIELAARNTSSSQEEAPQD